MNAVPNFGDLTFDTMWSANADRDKTTSARVGVYRGNAAIAIFSGTGGPPKVRIALPKYFNITFREVFKVVRKAGPDGKVTIPFNKWNMETKKMDNLASVTFGIDSTNVPYLGIVAPGMSPAKFPIRPDMKMDISAIPELNGHTIALDVFLTAMDNCVNAVNLTNFKRENGPGGGNRPAYNSGGNRPQNSPTPTGIDDDIPF